MKKDTIRSLRGGPPWGDEGKSASSPAFGPESWRPLAAAWMSFHQGNRAAELVVHGDDGGSERMPVSVFFRGTGELRPTDEVALGRVEGRILDGGAGVGSMALILQDRGHPVTAGEVVPEGAAIMRERGVADVRLGRVEELPRDHAFDTILLLMNGTALAGTLRGFPSFLNALADLLAPGGQVLMDSTDLLAPEDRRPDARFEGSPPGREWDLYPGEVQYQLEFEGERGAPFPQLFLDPATLQLIGREHGWIVEVTRVGSEGEYLARLARGS